MKIIIKLGHLGGWATPLATKGGKKCLQQQQHQLTAAAVATITVAHNGNTAATSATAKGAACNLQHRQPATCNNNNSNCAFFVIPTHTFSHVSYEACHAPWGEGSGNMATIMRIRHVARKQKIKKMAGKLPTVAALSWLVDLIIFLFSYLNISLN